MATKPKKSNLTATAPMGDWQAEDDLRTLMRAHEVKKDKKRHAKARALAKQKMMQAAAVAADPDNDGDSTGNDTDNDGA